nr:ribosomal protein L20 [Phymatolithon calcareum]
MKVTPLLSKYKKNKFTSFFVSNTNSIYFCTSLRYNLLNYFFKKNKFYLNKSVIYWIILEERGTYFSLIRWLFAFYNKTY